MSQSESCSVVFSSLKPMDYTIHGILQARILEWVAIPFYRGIFPIQGLNPGLPHYRWILYELSHQWNSRILEWVTYHFSSRYSRPRNRVRGPLLQADYLPAELLGRPIVVKWIKKCGVDRMTPQVGETDRSSIWCQTIACALSVVSSSLQPRGL